MRIISPRSLLAVAVLTIAPATVEAQTEVPATARTQVLSINPLTLMFGGIAGEYERQASATTTYGVGATLWAPDEFTYLSAEAKYRYYPQAKSLHGFSIGGTAGFTHVSTDYDDFGCGEFYECEDASATAATIGIELGYQWILGPSQNFAIALGVGAKRLFFLGDDLNGVSGGLPTARLSVGYAF